MRIFGKDTGQPVPMTWGRLLGLVGLIVMLAGALLDTTFENPILSAIGFALVAIGVALIGIQLVSGVRANDDTGTEKTQNGN